MEPRHLAGAPIWWCRTIKPHPVKEDLLVKWMQSDEARRAKAGWNLTAERVAKSPFRLGFNPQ